MHTVGLVAFVMIGIAVAILYMWIVGRVLGRGGDGFGLVGAIVTFPMLAFTTGLFCWVPLWLLHNDKFGPMSVSRAALLGLIVGLLVSIVVAGPSGFTMRGGSVLFNYFLMLLTTLGALVHNWALSRDSAKL
jgi:hypothetical protein